MDMKVYVAQIGCENVKYIELNSNYIQLRDTLNLVAKLQETLNAFMT
jgi:hypothetical protein